MDIQKIKPQDQTSETSATATKLAHQFSLPSNIGKILIFGVVCALLLGTVTGYILSTKRAGSSSPAALLTKTPENATQDTRTFRDFAEGTLKVKPTPKSAEVYVEGTHLLERDSGYPVTLTSSVVDLSKYEGKKVKVYGETQKALKEGWLMDVGRVEEVK